MITRLLLSEEMWRGVLAAPGQGYIHSDSCWGMIPHDGFSLYLVQTGQQKILLTDCKRSRNYDASEKILQF